MDTTVSTEWEQSAEVAELFKALVAAQGVMRNASRDAVNPFFSKDGRRASYATLAEVWDTCREPLTKNGLCVIQQPFTRGNQVGLRTMLAHVSGQYLACIALVVPKAQGAQEYGSVTTYLRRYALQAFAGVASEDDDAEGAEGRKQGQKPPGANWGPKAAPKPAERKHDPADTGEPITPGTLEDLRFKATAKFPKGRAARDWLKSITGTDDAASLSEFEGQRALKVLEAAA